MGSKKGKYRAHRWGRKKEHLVEIALGSKKARKWERERVSWLEKFEERK